MWKVTVLRGLFFSRVVQSSYLLNGWGKEFWRSARDWTSWELGIINLNVHFFLWVRELFVLHRMVERTWRRVLTRGYFKPRNFPSMAAERRASKCRLEMREYFAGEIKSKLRPKKKVMEGRFAETDESI